MRPITQTFLTNSTWTSPPNYQGPVFLEGCGGGGGGASYGAGGPGAPAAKFYQLMVHVEPFTTYNVTVGEGGMGSSVGGTTGSVGGNTSFGALATFKGGNSTDDVSFPGYFEKGSDSPGYYTSYGGYPGPFGPGANAASDSIPNNVPPVLNSGAGGGGASGTFLTGSNGSAGRLTITWWP